MCPTLTNETRQKISIILHSCCLAKSKDIPLQFLTMITKLSICSCSIVNIRKVSSWWFLSSVMYISNCTTCSCVLQHDMTLLAVHILLLLALLYLNKSFFLFWLKAFENIFTALFLTHCPPFRLVVSQCCFKNLCQTYWLIYFYSIKIN